MKKLIVLFGLILSVSFVTGVMATHNDKVTICHATGSQQNPYQQIEVATDAVDGVGNSDHNRSSHQNGEDIIPPGIWDVTGRNWTTQGQAIWYNNCNIPQPTPTVIPTAQPTATPTATLTPTPTIVVDDISPTPTVTECQDCVTPTPTDQPRVTATPTQAPKQEANTPTSGVNPGPRCENTPPTKTMANFHVYRKGDDAIVKWWPTEGDKANIYYKQVKSDVWQYSLRDIQNTGYVEIHGLGTLDITFAGQQSNGCAGGPLTNPVVDGNTNGWVLFR